MEVLNTSSKVAQLSRTNKEAVVTLQKRLAGYVCVMVLLGSLMLVDLIYGTYFFAQLMALYGIV